MENEAGGHRIQRIPPTERRGRVHSSTITVAVLGTSNMVDAPWTKRSKDDFRIEWFSGTVGAGGQNHQKTQNCVKILHIPTNTMKTAQTRSRKNSLKNAMDEMETYLDKLGISSIHNAENLIRKECIGSGERADRRRTWRFQEDRAYDHKTGKSAPVHRLLKGEFNLIW